VRLLLLVALVFAFAGCGEGGSSSAHRSATAPDRAARKQSRRADAPPGANAPLPRGPDALAARLAATTRSLEAEISDWLRAQPAVGARPPDSVALYALFQQRIYRYLRLRPALATRVIGAMPPELRPQARDNVAAGRSLYRLMPKKPPKTQPPVRIGQAEAPGRLLGWYRDAQRRFGVRWQVLAAINFVETGFNRMRNHSYAGAQGPMQFIPATWSAYGLGGDVRDPHDAIMGAANYLHASGAPADYRRAIYSYNPSPLYVDAIMRYARQMQRKTERFYAYWSWQVFARTKAGKERRLSGPGL
jgi:hypothetical protein